MVIMFCFQLIYVEFNINFNHFAFCKGWRIDGLMLLPLHDVSCFRVYLVRLTDDLVPNIEEYSVHVVIWAVQNVRKKY